ncbi:MAG: hypothetical protein ABIP51_01905 [Bacteroidia bacterium]
MPYDSGIRTQTITVYQPPIDTTIAITRAKGKTWLCEFYVNRIRFLYKSGKDSLVMNFDSERDIRSNDLLSPLGTRLDKYNFAFERDPDGLADYSKRTLPNADSTMIRIMKSTTLYEGYLVKVSLKKQ